MRILCPGCGAEYAIPDHAIPAAGREVQCAACTHAWYQLPAFHPGESVAPAALAPEAVPLEFALLRQGRAGAVHYHLLRRNT